MKSVLREMASNSGQRERTRNPREHAGDRADLRVAKRCRDRPQVARTDANISVRKDQQVVPGSACQSTELVDLVIGTDLLRRHHQANRQRGEIGDELADHGGGSVLLVRDPEQNFVFRIILTAEAGKIFVSFGIQPVNGLEDAHGRGEVARRRVVAAEEAAGREDDE